MDSPISFTLIDMHSVSYIQALLNIWHTILNDGLWSWNVSYELVYTVNLYDILFSQDYNYKK